MPKDACETCEAEKAAGLTYPRFKDKLATCFQCGQSVTRVLILHHTNADLCSPTCEQEYWIDMAF
jgi:hypothetical protein